MQGTANIVAAAKLKGIERVILVSSIGTDDPFFPLNLFFGVSGLLSHAVSQALSSSTSFPPGAVLCAVRFAISEIYRYVLQVLFFKKRAEEELQRSGLTYTIVRPGRHLDWHLGCTCSWLRELQRQ